MDVIHNYKVTKSVLFDNDRGFALAENPHAPSPFVTWQLTEENGKRDYYWGHYFSDGDKAAADFTQRVNQYQRDYGVLPVRVEPENAMPERYRYYSTQRPVDIGTFPKPADNTPLAFTNYDQRQPVEGGTMLAWGVLYYEKPLTQRQMDDYELKPATDNPDRAGRPSIAAQLKAAANRPEQGREAAPKKHSHEDR